MKTTQLSGSARPNVGKKDATLTRNSGLVPCVLYGNGEQTHFAVKMNDIEKIVFSPDVYQVELNIDGKIAKGIIRELQQHPITDKIMHVDFLELAANKPVRVSLPVRITGSAKGVMSGGKLMQTYRRLTIVGLPDSLPEAVTLDVTNLKIGNSIRVKDVIIENSTILDPANSVVVSVRMARGAVKPADDDDDEAETEA
jgi:large subunit ribosomal protein L25